MGNIKETNIKNQTYYNFDDMNNIKCYETLLDGYIKEKNGSKYLVFDSSNVNNEVLKKYAGLWYVIKNEIATINEGKKGEYDKDFMEIKFGTDDNLPLNKTLQFHMTIVIRSVFEEDGKLYPQIYLDERLYEL